MPLEKMSLENKRVCTRCVMDTTDPDIVFDDLGQCNHCTEFLQNKSRISYNGPASEAALEKLVADIKASGKGKKYDCVMGISGGVDSSYAICLAVQKGLRPLVVHFDNGWNSEIAIQNIRILVTGLKLDYESRVVDWEEFREVQLAFLKSSIVDLEIPTDMGIFATLFETAAKHGIRYIISGGNSASEGILPLTWGYHVMRDKKLYLEIVRKFSHLKKIKLPALSFSDELYYRFVRKVKIVYLLNYIDYDKEQARQLLQEKFDWRDYGGKHRESKITAFWQSYVMPVKYDMDYRKATYSSEICAGHMSREQALRLLETQPYCEEDVAQQKEFIARKFRITPAELEEYLQQPPKTFRDFRNNFHFLQRMYDLYKKLFRPHATGILLTAQAFDSLCLV